MELRIIELKGHHKACKNCGTFFKSIRSDAMYCSSKCGVEYRKKKTKRRMFWKRFWSALGFKSRTDLKNEGENLNKIDYARLTFILSFIGFLGSIGFYLGVLREVYSPARDKQKIEVLQTQNEELQQTVNVLIEELKEDE